MRRFAGVQPPGHSRRIATSPPEKRPSETAEKPGHSPWLWVAIGLAVVAVGLLVWGIVTRSQLDDAQAENDESVATQTAVIASLGKAYDELAAEMGVVQASLADAEQQVKDSSAAADQAQQDAESAQQDADAAEEKAQAAEKNSQDAAQRARDAEDIQVTREEGGADSSTTVGTGAERASADAEEAASQEKVAAEKERDEAVKAAESKTEVAKSCAKAYVSALGSLFEGDSVDEQVAAVRDQMQTIRADCSAALGGS